MQTDHELLAGYVRGSEEAFHELVRRHINLVYSAALRQCRGNSAHAEDVTQAVFTELGKRARSLTEHPALTGWLYRCVRLSSANLRRSETRRQRRELEAFAMNEQTISQPNAELWNQLRGELDDAMHHLNEDDRTAVLLRFFEGRSLKEVGAALRLTDNAARMRVERALERLRGLLLRRGITSTTAALAAALSAGAVSSAPPPLVANVAALARTIRPLEAGGFSWVADLGWKTAAAMAAAFVIVGALAFEKLRNPEVTRTEAPAELFTAAPIDHSSIEAPVRFTALETKPAAQMHLKVVDANTGEPLSGAKLHLFYLFQDGRGETVKAATDSSGSLMVNTLAPPFRGLNMFVTANAHVPKVTTWGFGRGMPEEYTIPLEPGLTISGLVLSESGAPIAGAQLEFSNLGNDLALAENIQFGPDAIVTSDAAGRWECNMVPRHLEKLAIGASHPNYADAQVSLDPQTAGSAAIVITMSQGCTLAGTVLDRFGRPIPGAKATELRLHSEDGRSASCDLNGAFVLSALKAGELSLVFQADRFAPVLTNVTLTKAGTELRVVLEPARVLRGRVMGEDGLPVAGAFVETTRGRVGLRWNTTTDSEGRFEWTSAPSEPLLYSVQAEGFKRAYAVELAPGEAEHEIRLVQEHPFDEIEISGRVSDENGTPLDRFTVLRSEGNDEWNSRFDFVTSGRAGAFTFSMPVESKHPNYRVRIEKEGYLPVISRTIRRTEASQQLDFRLEKAAGFRGLVLLPNGRPAENAEVFLCTTEGGVKLIARARAERSSDTTRFSTRTDSEGAFAFPPVLEPRLIVATHQEGYAELPVGDPETTGNLQLQAWGRIAGRLLLNSKPVARERIVASRHDRQYDANGQPFALVSHYFETQTDADGRFQFETVPPGACRVFRQTLATPAHRSGFESHLSSVQVIAGRTVEITLGGEGRLVRGKLEYPVGNGIDWRTVAVRLTRHSGEKPGPRPRRDHFISAADFAAASQRHFQLVQSEARYAAFCAPDGSFEIADVPAGVYELLAIVREESSRLVIDEHSRNLTAVVTRQIAVNESADPLDLGSLQMARQSAEAY